MGTVTKLNDVLCANISKVDDILKANASKWDDNSFCPSGPTPTPTPTPTVTPTPTPTPAIQTATLSATKYAVYTAGDASWTIAVNAISSIVSSIYNLAAASDAVPGRTGTNYFNTRTNVEFDLSGYSAYTILSAKLKLNVTYIDTSATPNQIYVLDLGGNSFSWSTPDNADYSLVYQVGNLDEYASDTVNSTGLYELGFSSTAIATANTYPAVYSMAILTYQDRNDSAPSLNTFYDVYFDTPELEITYQ